MDYIMVKVLIYGQMVQNIMDYGIKESINININRMNGKGCYTDKDGINWIGEFKNGQMIANHSFVRIPS